MNDKMWIFQRENKLSLKKALSTLEDQKMCHKMDTYLNDNDASWHKSVVVDVYARRKDVFFMKMTIKRKKLLLLLLERENSQTQKKKF
jgi:spore coat polysaccharide biosynthesis protein SpsF (cytidylyltransferase family)